MPTASPPPSVSSRSARSTSTNPKRRPRSPVSFFGDGGAFGAPAHKPPRPLIKLEKKSRIKKTCSSPSINLSQTSSETSLHSSVASTKEESSSGSLLKRKALSIASLKTGLSRKIVAPVPSPSPVRPPVLDTERGLSKTEPADSCPNEGIDQVLVASDAFVPLHPMPMKRHKSGDIKATPAAGVRRLAESVPPSPSYLRSEFVPLSTSKQTTSSSQPSFAPSSFNNHQVHARPESILFPSSPAPSSLASRNPARRRASYSPDPVSFQAAQNDKPDSDTQERPSASLHTSPLSLSSHSEAQTRPRTDSRASDDSGLEFFHDDIRFVAPPSPLHIFDDEDDHHRRRFVVRADRNLGEWRGQWNENDMDNVISRLRQLK